MARTSARCANGCAEMTANRGAGRKNSVSFLLCLVGPLVLGVALNALVRPALARSLGGVQHKSGAGVRSQDTWWSFDAGVQEAHPLLTQFLTISNGLVAMWVLALTMALLLARWVFIRRRRRSASTS